jgi:hypothetical protein
LTETFFPFWCSCPRTAFFSSRRAGSNVMYECRCPHDGKKLAEIGRPPFQAMPCDHFCACGRWLKATIIVELNHIIALVRCPCGCESTRVVGYVVTIQCSKCKTVTVF